MTCGRRRSGADSRKLLKPKFNTLLPSDPARAQKLFNANTALLSGLPNFDALNNRITNYADRHIGQQAGRDAFFGTGAGGGAAAASTGPLPYRLPWSATRNEITCTRLRCWRRSRRAEASGSMAISSLEKRTEWGAGWLVQ